MTDEQENKHETTNEKDGNQKQLRPPGRAVVSDLKSMQHQVGEHVMHALGHENSVAVLTAVVMGHDGQKRIVSAPLNPEQLNQVQALLNEANGEETQRIPCIGFHCQLKEPEDLGDTTPPPRDDS